MKNFTIISIILCIIICTNSANALDGAVEYNSVNIDYSVIQAKKYVKLGDNFLNKAEKTKNITKEKQLFYYGEALGSYIAATEANPELIDVYGKIGYIYGKLKKYSLAKSYLNKGLNMNIKNPTVNYYYGLVTYDMQNFNDAVKYLKAASKYNYYDKYEVNFKLGETNEKLADLVKARDAYAKALSARPNDTAAKAKIRMIDDLKYKNSQYYFRKKPFYYD